MRTNKEMLKKLKAAISVVLVIAMLITTAIAFLSASESKTNVFTVGKVNIELQEDGWVKTSDNGTYSRTDGKNADVLPGAEVPKNPHVKNTGTNPAWVYLTVGIPTAQQEDLYADEKGKVSITDVQNLSVDVTGFAIQEGYKECKNAEDVWNAFFVNDTITKYFGADTDEQLSSRIELFSTVTYDSDNNSIKGFNTADWQKVGSVYYGENGKNYYTYAYKTTLAAGTETTESVTSNLFDAVQLIGNIGEGKPVMVNYYGPSENENILSATSTDATNVPENYILLHSENIAVGDTINKLYFDDSLNKSGYTMDWIDVETDKSLYAGMTVTKSVDAIVEYKDLVVNGEEDPNPEPYDSCGYLAGSLLNVDKYDANSEVIGFTITGANPFDENYPTEPTNVVIPDYITIIKDGDNYSIDNAYLAFFRISTEFHKNDLKTLYSLDMLEQIFEKFKVNETTAKLPVLEIHVSGNHWNAVDEGYSLSVIAKKLIIPDSVKYVKYLGNMENKNDSVLEQINIPYSCNCIGDDASPMNSSNIQGLAYNGHLTNVIIPENVTIIGSNAFKETGIKNITIPNSIQQMGNRPLPKDCESVNISDVSRWANIKYQEDDEGVFYHENQNAKLLLNNKEITGTLTFDNTVTSIAPGAFETCKNITAVNIPNSVTIINDYAFQNCSSLSNITISDNVTYIGSRAFYNTGYYNNQSNWNNGALYIGKHLINGEYISSSTYTILEDTKTIAGSTFYCCNSLTNINIPNSVTSIGSFAFLFCENLENITIPNNVTKIGQYAFNGCSSLTSIMILNNSIYFPLNIFDNCSALTTINYSGTLEEWGTNIWGERNVTNPVTVYCTDGTVTI